MEGFDVMGMLPLVLIFVVMYFLIIRPQNKKAKKHQEMLGNLKKGDRIITSGGLIGHVHALEDSEISLEVAKDVHVKISRPMIATVVVSDEKKTSAKAIPAKASKQKSSSVKK